LNIYAAAQELKRVAKKRVLIVVPKERYHKYSANYHLHFFGGPEQLILLFGLKDCSCEIIDGALCYIGNL